MQELITRLTENPGFDGEAHFSADGRSIFFTRAKGGTDVETLSMSAEGGAVQIVKGIPRRASLPRRAR